jgi:uncharacterized protein (TIGR00290 family)
MKRILLSWSSGKDSAWTLHVLRQQSKYEVVGLLTTFNQAADRVAMHAVRRNLVERQAAAAGLPLWSVPLPWPCSNEQYETLMSEACAKAAAQGIEGVAFGDLFLEDVRAYRIRQMAGTNLEPLFPIWGIPTETLAREMVASGLKAILTCIDTRKLDRVFAGRQFDDHLLAVLPDGVDPCGENGEFHSFVYAGPMFRSEIVCSVGEQVTQEPFIFTDLVVGEASSKLAGCEENSLAMHKLTSGAEARTLFRDFSGTPEVVPFHKSRALAKIFAHQKF